MTTNERAIYISLAIVFSAIIILSAVKGIFLACIVAVLALSAIAWSHFTTELYARKTLLTDRQRINYASELMTSACMRQAIKAFNKDADKIEQIKEATAWTEKAIELCNEVENSYKEGEKAEVILDAAFRIVNMVNKGELKIKVLD